MCMGARNLGYLLGVGAWISHYFMLFCSHYFLVRNTRRVFTNTATVLNMYWLPF